MAPRARLQCGHCSVAAARSSRHTMPISSGCELPAAFEPALLLTLLERQEQLADPTRRWIVVRDRCDTDACSTQPEMSEDALATFAAFWNPFHRPAPRLWHGSCRPRGAGNPHTRSRGRGTRQLATAYEHRDAGAVRSRRTLTVCDALERGRRGVEWVGPCSGFPTPGHRHGMQCS